MAAMVDSDLMFLVGAEASSASNFQALFCTAGRSAIQPQPDKRRRFVISFSVATRQSRTDRCRGTAPQPCRSKQHLRDSIILRAR